MYLYLCIYIYVFLFMCFYLNKEPTEHKNPNVNIEPQWKTMDFSNYPHYFTAGQF